MEPRTPSIDEAAAGALADRLYDLALAVRPELPEWRLYRACGADRDYFVGVFPRLLELAREGPSGRAEFYIFELHKDTTASLIYRVARLWRETPDLPPGERAESEALCRLLAWFEQGAPLDERQRRRRPSDHPSGPDRPS